MGFLSATALQVVQVLAAALVLGAGLPAVFALGLRAWSPVSPHGEAVPATAGHRIAAVLCFAVVAAAIIVGIGYLVLTGHRG